jgi:uncharacterized membrane protein YphA (DoxX/SURF4 family)
VGGTSEAMRSLGSGMDETTALALGRTFVGVAAMASGVLQLVTGDFVRLVPKLPAWIPAPAAWAYLVGVVLVVIGLALVSGRLARAAASVLAVMILVDVLFLYAPQLVVHPVFERPYLRGFMWTNPLKCLALIGGAAILAARSSGEPRPLSPLVRGVGSWEPLGAVFVAAFFVVGGVQHFVYNDFVTELVPAWIPGRRFWAYFTGVALIAGGTGILVRPFARLAATMSALMIFLWVLTLHIPRSFAGPNHANEIAGTFEALALSGVALIVAASRGSTRR